VIRQCYYCGDVFGEKEPLEDKQTTSGECPLCHFLFTVWYRGWRRGVIKEPSSEFISECRRTLAENQTERRIESYLPKNRLDQSLGC
jgi:hypothetical protein